VLVLALGIAVGSAKLFSVSMALGAFLAGMVVGRSPFSLRAATEALPMRDAFAVLFFVSVGMLFNPRHLIASPGLVAGTLAVILIGKPLAAMAIVLWMRYPLRTAISVSVALAQIGEFSFILAAAGQDLAILDDAAVNALIAAAIISISINPILYRLFETKRAMTTMKPTAILLAALGLALLTSCSHQPAPEVMPPGGVVEVEPIETGRVQAGQTIYVPAYSAIHTSDPADRFELAITLGIRNTDRAHPIVVTTAGYYHQDGQLVRGYVKKPLRIAPLASAEFFVKESDRSAGILASFLVEWVAEQKVSAPVVESVMVGLASSRGVSFRCPGRVLADRSFPGRGE
jgi:hypothetical protein